MVNRFVRRGWLWWLLVLAMPCGATQALRYGVLKSGGMPYQQYQGPTLVGGIVFDLAQALGVRLGMPVEFVIVPRKRRDMFLQTGAMDVLCGLAPEWTDAPGQFDWSPPLFDVSNVLVGNQAMPRPAGLPALEKQGAVVGAVLGYRYSALDAYFAAGKLVREDAVDQEIVMRKLSLGRTPYALTDVFVLGWYLRQNPQHQLAPWTLLVESHAFQCAIPKTGSVDAKAILEALERLQRDGAIDAMHQRYK